MTITNLVAARTITHNFMHSLVLSEEAFVVVIGKIPLFHQSNLLSCDAYVLRMLNSINITSIKPV